VFWNCGTKSFWSAEFLLCKATEQPLKIIDFSKPFNLYVDGSDYAIAGILTQKDEHELDRPVAFASRKLSDTHKGLGNNREGIVAAL